MMTHLTIGDLARQAGVGVETVRFYERTGLLEPPQRKQSGYRQYDEETVETLRFIRRAKELGFTLKEIKSLLTLQADAGSSRQEIREQAKGKVAQITGKIADLERMRAVLQSLVDQCHGDGSMVGCPILEALRGPTEASAVS